jgi:hypothetical protein
MIVARLPVGAIKAAWGAERKAIPSSALLHSSPDLIAGHGGVALTAKGAHQGARTAFLRRLQGQW